MVDMISLCQSYKQWEITEVKWIQGYYNPVDFMTKAKPLVALKTLIDINRNNINTTKWVECANLKQASTDI